MSQSGVRAPSWNLSPPLYFFRGQHSATLEERAYRAPSFNATMLRMNAWISFAIVSVVLTARCHGLTIKPLTGARPSSKFTLRTSSILQESAAVETVVEECPPGYYLDSLNNCCQELGPLGKASQYVESHGPWKKAYTKISNLFGIDTKRISSLGVAFALSYSIISSINGSISLSIAWFIACKRVRKCCRFRLPHLDDCSLNSLFQQ